MEIDYAISEAWLQAANDLGIRVTAPFVMKCDGEAVLWEAYIADFGGPAGTVVGSQHSPGRDERQVKGYYASNLWPSYRVYSRKLFIDTLNDWRWFGDPESRPSWYTGQPWS